MLSALAGNGRWRANSGSHRWPLSTASAYSVALGSRTSIWSPSYPATECERFRRTVMPGAVCSGRSRH